MHLYSDNGMKDELDFWTVRFLFSNKQKWDSLSSVSPINFCATTVGREEKKERVEMTWFDLLCYHECRISGTGQTNPTSDHSKCRSC